MKKNLFLHRSKPLRIGLLREGKVPPDRRVPFAPNQCIEIMARYPGIQIVCQNSPHRCYPDQEYKALGIEVSDDMSTCDILFGIKEVPMQNLLAGKTYFFFSHTIKKQPHNQKLLESILEKKIRLIDYETLKDKQGIRLAAFGRFAGIVGTFNAFWTYGKRMKLYSLRRAYECFDMEDLKTELKKISLPPIKIILTGAGRVSQGAMEMLDAIGIKKIKPENFLVQTYPFPVYAQLSSDDYHIRKDKGLFNREEYHVYPNLYDCVFLPYAHKADILIAGAFWNPRAPKLFTVDDMASPDFKIKVIADITCDINGSIPSTKKASSLLEPIYDYNAQTDQIEPPLSNENNITVMAIDNLPCELSRDASLEFGQTLMDKILPPLFGDDPDNIIPRATITDSGKLTENFSYLEDYATGKTSPTTLPKTPC